jgi:hypothetical protein
MDTRENPTVPPLLEEGNSSFRRRHLALAAVLFLAVLSLLLCFDPATHALYPLCYFRKWTGWLCPGCGGLRATHQLLHGHVLAAWRLNPLFVGGLPVLAFFQGRRWVARFRGRTLPRPLGAAWFWGGCLVAMAFAMVRNLPLAASLGWVR